MNKNQAERFDYLIIGLGLAGSAVAMHLLDRKRKFLVIDQPEKNISSKIAAGIYNPITGRNWVKTWMADEIFPYMHSYYIGIEKMTNKNFLYDKVIYRPFSTISEQNDWIGKYEDPQLHNYARDLSTSPVDTDIIKNPYGGLSISQGGNLKVNVYLASIRKLLIDIGCYKEEYFDIEQVQLNDDTCEYRNFIFDKIIFCQGPVSRITEMWNFLPLKSVKGEVLKVHVKKRFDKIYNKGVFVLPSGNGECRIGSTYQRKDFNSGPTKWGKDQLVEKLKTFFKPSFEIVGHDAGIRPATIDRKPFLGMHPNDKKLVIFNGLGAKGVTLAPYFANHLLDYLENDRLLAKEVGIDRFIR